MWNDTTSKNFIAPKPNFLSRTISPKEYFREKMK